MRQLVGGGSDLAGWDVQHFNKLGRLHQIRRNQHSPLPAGPHPGCPCVMKSTEQTRCRPRPLSCWRTVLLSRSCTWMPTACRTWMARLLGQSLKPSGAAVLTLAL